MVKKETLKKIGLICILIVAINFVILGYVMLNEVEEIEPVTFSKSEKEILDNCRGYALFDTVYCLNDEIKEIYNFNLANKDVLSYNLSFDKLVEQGGVCKHYAHYYEKFAEELGFYSKHITLTPKVPHGFSVIYGGGSSSYCVVDQTEAVCIKL